MTELKVPKEFVGTRLDKALKNCFPDKSRSYLTKCIEEGKVLVNQEKQKPSYLLSSADLISYEDLEAKPLELTPQDLHLQVIYEDGDVAVVFKPKGMVVHPGSGQNDATLVHGLLYELEDLSGINGVFRPGIVHRIDKDTSGLLMVAKSDLAAISLTEQLKKHECKRTYQALVHGTIAEDAGKIIAPIGRSTQDRKKMAVTKTGKEAITHFKVLHRFQEFTWIECELETGRTHQIRVHMAYIGHPLVDDTVYGYRKSYLGQGQFLHAKTIGFTHPKTKKWMKFDSEMPSYFMDFVSKLQEKKD